LRQAHPEKVVEVWAQDEARLGLKPIARRVWADPRGAKVLVLVLDRAGWHIAKELKVPANVVLFHLPSCTPELQPVEPLWPLVREAMANKTFASLGALQEPLVKRCEWLAKHPEVLKGAVGFHWAVALG
jgi:transposase